MFVVQGLNVSEASPDVGSVCSVAGCDADSLLNQASRLLLRILLPATIAIFALSCSRRVLMLPQVLCTSPLLALPLQVAQASRAPWSSWLATPAASWLDDFLTWASPEIPQASHVMFD